MGFTFFISIVVAVVTAVISQKGFYKKETWLRKEKKYSEIIDNLSILLKYYGDMFHDSVGAKKYNGEDCIEEINKAKHELERLSMIPSFIINSKVRDILKELFHQANIKFGDDNCHDFASYLDRMYGVTKDSIIEIDSLARRDLKIK